MPTYLSSMGYRHPWVAVTVILFQQQLTNPNCTKGPHHRGRIYLHLWWLSQNCYLFSLSIPLFQFSFHGEEQGFSKSQRISCLLRINVEKAKRGQLENSRVVVRARQRNVHVHRLWILLQTVQGNGIVLIHFEKGKANIYVIHANIS